MMRDVAIVASQQVGNVRRASHNDIEMLTQAINGVMDQLPFGRDEIGFTCFGSSDYLTGVPFSFVRATDYSGSWPPIAESHVEMDGAWAFYEAVMRLQHGDIDLALVYSFGKSSLGDLPDVLALQLDPYCVAPLGPDSVSVAALQANALLEASEYTERDFAEVAARSRRDAMTNPNAQLAGDVTVDDLLEAPYLVYPLRKHDCPPITDAAAAVVLATAERARVLCETPIWIRGIDHRIEAHHLGSRELVRSPSTATAADAAGVGRGHVDFFELHAPFTHQELILRDALGLSDDVVVNPSGGALASNPVMSAGLIRLIETSNRLASGEGTRAVAHATSGPCLQHNLVAVMEKD